VYQILWEGSYCESEDQVRVSLRSVEGCGSNGQKTPLSGDCLHFKHHKHGDD